MTDKIDPASAFDDEAPTAAKETKEPKSTSRARAKAAPKAQKEERVTIILEENDNIPPNGQFIGVNGKGYILKPGHKVDVPVSVLGVLDLAIEKRPVLNDGGVIIGWRDAMRFPYRVLR